MPAIRRLSAAGPLQLAIDAALLADVAIVARIVDRAYSVGTTPKDTPLPYVEYGDSAEASSGTFGRGGNEGTEELTVIVDRTGGKPAVLALYGDIQRVLETGPVTIAGHQIVRLRVELVTVYADPDGLSVRGVVRCRVISWTNGP